MATEGSPLSSISLLAFVVRFGAVVGFGFSHVLVHEDFRSSNQWQFRVSFSLLPCEGFCAARNQALETRSYPSRCRFHMGFI